MTSLLPPRPHSERDAGEINDDLRHRRPLALVAVGAGIGAALLALIVICAVAVVGWFLTGTGTFGEPADAVRAGASIWMMGHGSGVVIGGVSITIVPLAVTAGVLWTLWQIGLRAGISIAGHGPDSDAIADGQRDWTVPVAVALFAVSYGATVATVGALTSAPETALNIGTATGLALVMAVLCGGVAIAVGSGRAPIWLGTVPLTARIAARGVAWLVIGWAVLSAVALTFSLISGFSTTTNLMSQLDLSTGEALAFTGAMAMVAPNAALFAGSFIAGPGFTVGLGTIVAPSGVVLGPLPMIPLLGALPGPGTPATWVQWLVVLPALLAALVIVMLHRRFPTVRWDQAVVRALVVGIGAALVVGVMTHWSGGAIGPGRMSDVAPNTLEVTVRLIGLMGIGAVLASLAMTGLSRRSKKRAE